MNIDNFKLPIEYNKKKKLLDKNIIEDLELNITSERNSLYEYVFQPKTIFGKNTIDLWAKYYTDDKNFIKDSQKLIKKFNNPIIIADDISLNEIFEIYKDIEEDTNFIERYQYIDFSWFRYLNNNSKVLQALTIYNISSPIISLLTPIIMLIIPFFIIKLQQYPITLENYIIFLKLSFSKHALGPLLNGDFNKISLNKKIYFIISIGFYIYQIYLNIKACIRFNDNMIKIHDYLFKLKNYMEYSVKVLDNYYNYSKKLKSYELFNNNLVNNKNILLELINKIQIILPYKLNLKKIYEIGYTLQIFYSLKNDIQYLQCLNYTFNFNGYIDNISGLKQNIKDKFINLSKFSNKCKFTNAYFGNLIHSKPIKNSYELDKHILITGPNAAGKTTLLKSTLFNIILNQQLGCGFYDNAYLKLYNSIHCYINIPDTSGRDSLFQAEARRCKEILDKIKTSTNKNHFCVFDELYSGTNPYEAIGSSYSFIKYLNNFDNLNLILTTHYTDLCIKLDKEENIKNHNMKIISDDKNEFKYTYKLINGISNIKGGTKVLNDLNYPSAIVSSVKEMIPTLKI